jgi:hypothetical protein
MFRAGYIGHQTMKNSLGGCWQGLVNFNSSKLIKGLNQNIIWSITYLLGVPVHTLTVYMPCGTKKNQEPVSRDLAWILYRVFSINPESKVVVTGDFNKCTLNSK